MIKAELVKEWEEQESQIPRATRLQNETKKKSAVGVQTSRAARLKNEMKKELAAIVKRQIQRDTNLSDSEKGTNLEECLFKINAIWEVIPDAASAALVFYLANKNLLQIIQSQPVDLLVQKTVETLQELNKTT